MALRIGEHSERDTGYLLGRLHDRAAELLGLIKRRGHIRDTNKEKHLVSVGLQRADRRRRSAFGTGRHERVPRICSVRIAPAEQVRAELPGSVWVTRADLGMDNGMRHVAAPRLR